MDIHQMRRALLKITLAVLAVTSWISASFILSTKPDKSEAGALMNLARLPASLPANVFAPTLRVIEPVKMDVMKVACWDAGGAAEQHVNSRWIRLTGRGCEKANQKVLSVRNLDNGYAATVFDGQAALTTDYIPLEAGRNRIEIRFEQSPGVTVENQFTFFRR